MEKDFTPYEQALELKGLEFNRRTFATYSTIQNNKWILTRDLSGGGQYPKDTPACIAPTFSQSFRFFREKYDYDVTIKKCTPSEYKFEIEQLFVKGDNYYFIDFPFTSYEEAELECLKKLIEIVKQK